MSSLDKEDITDMVIDSRDVEDDEELEATRRLNGVVKDSNIEIIEDFINEIKDFELNKDIVEIANALEDILAEREVDKKKIKELEEENKRLKAKIDVVNWQEKSVKEILEEKYLPKQKVKDILQKNRNELFSVTYLDDEQYKPYTMQIDRINKIEKELLEDK